MFNSCLLCGQPVQLKALVPAFLDEPDWIFWGSPGCRFIVCQSPTFVHFKVLGQNGSAGQVSHRLALIDPNAYLSYNEPVVITDDPQPKRSRKRVR